MTQKLVHLIVEKGPDQGLEITIPAQGARLGRSSNNDIVLKDPAMSRFHCRFFFKPGEGLWAEDLGSANQTLMNDKPLFEARAHIGDRLTIGDTILKIVSEETPTAESAPAPAREPAAADKAASAVTMPIGNLFEPSAAAKGPGDIQFRRPPPGSERRRRIVNLLGLLLIVIIAAGAAFIWKLRPARPVFKPGDDGKPAGRQALEIAYEKVQANSNNIFRYYFTLKDDQLSIQVDDLKNKTHVPGNQLKKIEPDIIKGLEYDLTHNNFFELKDEYKGIPTDVWDVWDLTITIGKKTKRVKVMNTLEVEAFKKTREAIESFGQTELKMDALSLSAEKRQELALQESLLGNTLYDQSPVKRENLFMAIRSFKLAEWYLETIEPKPDYYAETVGKRRDAERKLQEIYENHLFLAARAIRLNDWAEAAVQYRQIKEEIPDQSDERYIKANKELIDVERRIPRHK